MSCVSLANYDNKCIECGVGSQAGEVRFLTMSTKVFVVKLLSENNSHHVSENNISPVTKNYQKRFGVQPRRKER